MGGEGGLARWGLTLQLEGCLRRPSTCILRHAPKKCSWVLPGEPPSVQGSAWAEVFWPPVPESCPAAETDGAGPSPSAFPWAWSTEALAEEPRMGKLVVPWSVPQATMASLWPRQSNTS